MTDLLAQILANPIVDAVGLALGIGLVALWLAAAWWAYGDASWRTESPVVAFAAAGWIVLSTPLMLPLSLGIYRTMRPQIGAADQRAERLAIVLAESSARPACPECARRIDSAWRRCPACATWLASPCANCGTWSDASFDICPHCAAESRGEPAVLDSGGLPASAGLVPASAPTVFHFEQQKAAAGGSPAAAGMERGDVAQRGVRIAASSSRPVSYAASRDSLSAPS